MNIWLVTIGEPVFHPDNKLRLHRTGILSKHITENTNHEVVWWTSAFNHFTKQHMYGEDSFVDVNDRLKMIALYGKGYKRNISIDRIQDHKQIADKFLKLAPTQAIPDIIVAAFPTLGLCEAAISYGKKHNIPVIIDYRDMWPEVFVDILPKKIRIAGRIALFHLFAKTSAVFANATGLIGITDEFLSLALNKTRRLKRNHDAVFPLGYLENQYSESELEEADRYWSKLNISRDSKKICFFGTLGYQSDLETVIEAANLPQGEKYQFIICGTGDKLEALKKINGDRSNLIFPGYMSAAQIKALMNLCDYGLCPYIPKEAFLNSIPGKAIEYFSSGLPIISTLGNGVLGRYLNTHKIGVNYQAYDPVSLIKGLEILDQSDNDSMRTRILDLFQKRFSAKTVYADYVKHLEDVVSSF